MNEVVEPRPSPRISILRYPLSQITRTARRLVRTKCEYETLRTWYLDSKFGGDCGGEKASPFASIGMNGTQSAEYWMLDVLFKKRAKLAIRPSDVLVDVGCGKGRVINYWLMRGLTNRMIGVEIDSEVAELTRRRLQRFPNVSIVTGDINDNIPPDATIFWLYNPFNERIMREFKRSLEQMFADRRNVTLLYYLCHQVRLFRDDPIWNVTDLGSVNRLAAALINMTPGPVASS
jgi:SAM-dependent methyltransferase